MAAHVSNANPATTPPAAPLSSAQRYLSNQIDQCAENVAGLLVTTQKQKNAAVVAGEVATADTLSDQAIQLSVQYGDLSRHQLKTIDDSTIMNQTIKGFADVNANIKSATTQIQDLTTFANDVTTIVSTLDGLITSALFTA
jgi:hypothetical protein